MKLKLSPLRRRARSVSPFRGKVRGGKRAITIAEGGILGDGQLESRANLSPDRNSGSREFVTPARWIQISSPMQWKLKLPSFARSVALDLRSLSPEV